VPTRGSGDAIDWPAWQGRACMPPVRRQGHAPFGQHVLFSDIPEIL